MTDEPTIPANSGDGSLDPADFDDFRQHAHDLLDACLDQLAAARDRPWRTGGCRDESGAGARTSAQGHRGSSDRR
ncbi:MAG TPA: hypothetical protein VK862_14645 [Afifellaceae bacterium]|nr:hypothetical protein [Afifellaceae bacterium]